MASKQDKVILNLKKEIEIKKENLGKTNKFVPITNCNLFLENNRINIHTLTKESILLYIAKLKALELALKQVLPDEVLMIDGYSVKDWIEDLVSKYNILNVNNEKERLRMLENKLNELLSNETKIDLELEKLKNQI